MNVTHTHYAGTKVLHSISMGLCCPLAHVQFGVLPHFSQLDQGLEYESELGSLNTKVCLIITVLLLLELLIQV